MAFSLKTPALTREERIRIGPISIFTLIAVICLAILAVLAFSTATASKTLAERQQSSISTLYANESAAQHFVAELDDALDKGGVENVEPSLDACIKAAVDASGGETTVTARMEGDTLFAEFTNSNGRALSIELAIRGNATYRINKWKVIAVQNDEQPQGNFWTGD